LERVDRDRVNEIARHFLEAREEARALPYLVEAAERAARAYATPEAIGLYQRAFALVPANADAALARRVYEGLGQALELANDISGAVKNFQAMRAEGETRRDMPMQVSALNKLASLMAMRLWQFPEAEALMAESEKLARSSGDN